MRRPRARHARRLTGALALGLALAGCGGEPGRDVSLTVRVVVRDGALRTPGDPCAGARPYLYVHASAPYRVQDSSAATLARGRLPDGRAVAEWDRSLGGARMPTTCQMTLRLHVPERPRYALVLPGGAPLRFSARAGRTVALAIGAGEPADGPAVARRGAVSPSAAPPAGAAGRRGGAASPRAAGRRDGAAAPDFTLPLLDGTPVTGRRLWSQRPLVLLFFTSWCGACARQQDALAGVARRFGDRVRWLGIAGQGDADGLGDHPVAIDASLAVWRSYAVREPPAVVLVGPGGRLLRGWPGGVDAAALQAELRRALA